jgi:hypothetical protein
VIASTLSGSDRIATTAAFVWRLGQERRIATLFGRTRCDRDGLRAR